MTPLQIHFVVDKKECAQLQTSQDLFSYQGLSADVLMNDDLKTKQKTKKTPMTSVPALNTVIQTFPREKEKELPKHLK